MTGGIQIYKPKHRLQLKSGFVSSWLVPKHCGQPALEYMQIVTLAHRHAFNNIIDQANEIRGVKQMCLSEGCDGQALCKALLDCNHPLHHESLQLTSGIRSCLLKKEILQQQHHQNT